MRRTINALVRGAHASSRASLGVPPNGVPGGTPGTACGTQALPGINRVGIVLGLLVFLGMVAHASSAETIKVGEYASLTGKDASLGQASHNGTLLAIEEI